MRTTAALVAKPYQDRYPGDDYSSCLARSIHDMQRFGDRIYLAVGDWWNNTGGPVPITSFQERDGEFLLREEITVNEEAIVKIRRFDDGLYLPGVDAMGNPYHGSFYRKPEPEVEWVIKSTIPNANHVTDVASFGGEVFVNYATHPSPSGLQVGSRSPRPTQVRGVTAKSGDGERWEELPAPVPQPWEGEMIAMDDHLLFVGGRWVDPDADHPEPLVVTYVDGALVPIFPASGFIAQIGRIERFKAGVVFSPNFPGTLEPSSDFPLYAMDDWAQGPVAIDRFGDDTVGWIHDIVVCQDSVFVLSVVEHQAHDSFLCRVERSDDLRTWERFAEFTVPAVPYSMELQDGNLYIGLGQIRWPWPHFPNPPHHPEPQLASGSIWRIE